jgi:hypothetical protein
LTARRTFLAVAFWLAPLALAFAQETPPADAAADASPPTDVPADGAPEAPDAKPPDVPVSGEARRAVFEYIEELKITGPAAEVIVKSNVLVMVTTGGEKVTVDVRPNPSRTPTDQDDPAPGRVTLTSSNGDVGQWDIAPQSAVFDFTPGPKAVVSVGGAEKDAANEAITVLSQGPCENTPNQESTTAYKIEVRSDRRPMVLSGEQRTGELWVDWRLTGAGTFDVGAGGWEMPMSFVLPTGPANAKGTATLTAEAGMRYSSVRPGPEEGTTLLTTLSLQRKKEAYTYVRSAELTPVAPPAEEPSEKDRKPANVKAKGALAGGASAWARTATLATLGVQRLAGVRETGLAMWLAQAAIDSAAGREVPRAADNPQKRAIKTVEKLSPRLEPPEGLIRDDLFSEKWLVRFETGQNVMSVLTAAETATLLEYSTSGTVIVPNISLSVRRKLQDRWRLGVGVDAILVRVDTGDPRMSWSTFGYSARAEYLAERWNIGLLGGIATTKYDMNSSSRTARGDLTSTLYGLELEWVFKKRWGLALQALYSGDISIGPDALNVGFAQPAVRWYFAKNAALQFHLAASHCADKSAVGGEVQSNAFGTGVGVTMRW